MVDTFRAATPVPLPTWFRWLPRALDPAWFDEELLACEQALLAEPKLENAKSFAASAVRRGKELMILEGDHDARVDLLRFAAVKLWDVSRRFGFEQDHHGFPEGMPAYPYEVGSRSSRRSKRASRSRAAPTGCSPGGGCSSSSTRGVGYRLSGSPSSDVS